MNRILITVGAVLTLMTLTACSNPLAADAPMMKTVEQAEQIAGDKTPQTAIAGLPGEARIVGHQVNQAAGSTTITVTVQNVSASPDTYTLVATTISGLEATTALTIPAGATSRAELALPGAFDAEATLQLNSQLLGNNIAVTTVPLN